MTQWVESSDLEAPTQLSDPAKYHDAWRSVVGAGYVLSCPRDIALKLLVKGVFSSLEALDSVERRVWSSQSNGRANKKYLSWASVLGSKWLY